MVLPAWQLSEGEHLSFDSGQTQPSVHVPEWSGALATASASDAASPPAIRRRSRQANPYVVLPLIGLLLFGAGLALVSQRVHWMTLTYELEVTQRQLTSLQQTHARLQAAVAGAAALEKVEATARTRLGMVDPGARTAIVVGPAEDTQLLFAETPSALAVVGSWLQERLTTTAEAGERVTQ